MYFWYKLIHWHSWHSKATAERFTKGKKESDSDEPIEEDEDEKEEAEDNDFVFLDFVGKKGKN